MTRLNQRESLGELVRRFEPDGRLLRAWELRGGVSARVTALEIERPNGATKKLVVRRHGGRDRRQNPNVAADEFRLLQITRAAGLPTPAPRHLDQTGEVFATPYIVIEYVEGETEFAPNDPDGFLVTVATQLSKIHRINALDHDLSFLADQSERAAENIGNRAARLDESIDEGRIRDALVAVLPWPQRNESVLLHGDYWPGNILWKDGRLAAIIDWEDARVGDPLADLANSRLEILWALGIDAMKIFTDHYESLMTLDFTGLPYWDLYAALKPAFKIAEWAGGDAAEKAMREGLRLFVAQALEKLSAG